MKSLLLLLIMNPSTARFASIDSKNSPTLIFSPPRKGRKKNVLSTFVECLSRFAPDTAVGEQLFNLIPAAEEVRAKNKNFKVHKFMWKILGCSFYIFLRDHKLYIFITSKSRLGCRSCGSVVAQLMCSISGDDSFWIHQRRQRKFESLNLYLIFSLPCAGFLLHFHIPRSTSEVEMTSPLSIHAQRAQLFPLVRGNFRRKECAMAEYITIYFRGRAEVLVRFFRRSTCCCW